MNRIQKLLSLLLILALALSLSGCSVVTITKAAKTMSSLESVTADVSLDLSVDMTMMDESMPFAVSVSGPFDFDLANGKGKASLTVDLMGEPLTILFYYEKLEDKVVTYVSADGGANWTKTETPVPAESEKSSSSLKSLAMLKKLSASFEETGTETVNGNEAVLYSGNILWEELAAEADLSAAMETAGSAAGTELDLSGFDLAALGSIPVTIGYDKQNALVVKASADLTETVQNLVPMIMKIAMQSIAAQSGEAASGEMEMPDLSTLGIDVNIQLLTVSADLYNFDAVGEIVIPAEALAAEAIPLTAVAA